MIYDIFYDMIYDIVLSGMVCPRRKHYKYTIFVNSVGHMKNPGLLRALRIADMDLR